MARNSRARNRAAAAGTRWGGRAPAGHREHRVRFWEAIARGASSEKAAVEAGVLPSIGVRWLRKGGGMPPLTLAPVSGRYLTFTEREEITVLLAAGCGVREIARRLGRAPSSISRELQRNAAIGQNLAGRKPTEPRAALTRAEIDHAVAETRLDRMHQAVAAQQAAPERGEKLKAPPPCRGSDRSAEASPDEADRSTPSRPGPHHSAGASSEHYRSRQPDHEDQGRVGAGPQRPRDRQLTPDRARL